MKSKASNIYGWLQNAMFDMAEGELFPEEDWKKIDTKADELFNDERVMRDLIGDAICNEVGFGNKKEMLELANALKEIGHTALKNALEEFIKDQKLEDKGK